MQQQEEIYEGLSLKELNDVLKNPSQEWRVYLAAQIYARAGIYVLPVVQNGKALPRKTYNVNYGHASRSNTVIEGWFHPDKGKFAGWNLGIATGRAGGVFAIDVDRKGENDGLLALRRLEDQYGKLPEGPIQSTPGGGFHFLFQWQENAEVSTGKIAPLIDTRGGTETQCKSHIVAFPSLIDGKMYKWEDAGPIPELPPWVTDRLGILWKKPPQIGRGNENVGADDLERPIEKHQIISMLESIDPNSCEYDDWLKIGLSIKSQLPGDNGLAIWDKWSKKGDRYKKGECVSRWRGFSDCGSVRGGTLFYYAKQAGWKPNPEKNERSGNPYDEIVAEMNEQYAVTLIGGKIRIIREKKTFDETQMHFDLMDKDSFAVLMSNRKMMSGGKNPKLVPVSAIWLAHEGRRTYENGMGLFPDDIVPDGYYNTWNGFSVTPREGDCSLFLKHVEEVLCGGDLKLYRWLLDWCADLVQDPANPKGCAVIMRGGEGCGKGTFANAIGDLFGPHHRHLINDIHLTNNFNSHFFDAITVFADEITWGGNKKSAGVLKGMVTEKTLMGERKNVDAIMYHNRVHLIVASNSDWVIPAGADSRRWFMLDVLPIYTGKRGYFNAIADELDNGGRGALLHFLLNRKIKSNLRRAPVTEILQEQRILNVQDDSVLHWWVRTIMGGKINSVDEYGGIVEWPERVDKSGMYGSYEQYCSDRKLRTSGISVFCKEMLKYGIRSSRPTINKRRVYMFELPDIETCRSNVNDIYEGIFGKETDDEGDVIF